MNADERLELVREAVYLMGEHGYALEAATEEAWERVQINANDAMRDRPGPSIAEYLASAPLPITRRWNRDDAVMRGWLEQRAQGYRQSEMGPMRGSRYDFLIIDEVVDAPLSVSPPDSRP